MSVGRINWCVVPTLVTSSNLHLVPDSFNRLYSLKFDGERRILEFKPGNGLTCMNRTWQRTHFGGKELVLPNCTIDCEYIELTKRLIVMDCVITDKSHFNAPLLLDRLAYFRTVIMDKLAEHLFRRGRYLLEVKPYFQSMRALLVAEQFQTIAYDGYIITSLDGSRIFKMKQKQTADFQIGKGGVKNGRVLHPLVNYGTDGLGNYNCEIQGTPPFHTEGDVIECSTEDGQNYQYVRPRYDKKRPNNITVIQDIDEYLRNPINLQSLESGPDLPPRGTTPGPMEQAQK